MRAVPSTIDLVDHLVALTARVNTLDEDVLANTAQLILISGDLGKLQSSLVDQVNKLTKAIRELRENLVPDSEARKELITLPEIIVEKEIQAVLAQKELERRRSDSMRAKAEEADKKKIEFENELAGKRDIRNLRIGLYVTLFAGVITELVRILLTHAF